MLAGANDIAIQPLGAIRPELLARIQASLQNIYGSTAAILPPLKIPREAWIAARQQYDSTKIIRFMTRSAPAAPERILGVCDVDLCTPILTFVFGAAEVGGRFAVISLQRLRPEAYGLPADRLLFMQRCAKAAVHELGHTFGLRHCYRYDCIMFSCCSVEGTDLKQERFCPRCAEKLRDARKC
ncbi:MAG: archaemetzincin family Zn-dependent metalloprotease [Candidatus Eisenbacteria sp.]|nr:archaemetzincin family Zn-dependent metalloprotease [Candidatus Eisenbacteria bacterium]